MRTQNTLVHDEYVPANTTSAAPVYTSQAFNAMLGQNDQLTWHVVADNWNANAGNVQVDLEHSADGRTWTAKSPNTGTPAVLKNASVAMATGTVQDVGYDQGVVPNLGFCRFKVYFSTSTCAGHVKIFATGRDQK